MIKNNRKALLLMDFKLKKISLLDSETPLSKIKYVEQASIEPNLSKGTFQKLNAKLDKLEKPSIKEEEEIKEDQNKFKEITELINKGVQREDQIIQPSKEFMKAFDLVQSMGGAVKLPDRIEALGNAPINLE